MRKALVLAQAATFFGLAGVLFCDHNWRLGAAQLALGVVTALVYL